MGDIDDDAFRAQDALDYAAARQDREGV